MLKIALKMLVGDTARYIGIVLGITFACLVMTQQGSIFNGLMSRTYGFLTDTQQPDIWVMDPEVKFVDDFKPMQFTSLLRVRGVKGVSYAVPLYKGNLKARLSSGVFQQCNLIGVDDASLIGAPSVMVQGSISDLRRADGVIVDEVGAASKLASDVGGKKIPLRIGDVLELNDHRAVVVGIAKVSRTFQTQPVVFTTYNRANRYAPPERRQLSFVLVKSDGKQSIVELARRIELKTGLMALTRDEFVNLTFNYYAKNTGIPINFGIAVLLGFIVGSVIAGQTFYNFTLDNSVHFATLKAMGARNATLFQMILLQSLVVGIIGYGMGVGLASLFYYLSVNSELAFKMPWQLLVGVGFAVVVICSFSSFLSILKVWRVDPAIVFKS
jgi:putative ABC transport system permease protein